VFLTQLQVNAARGDATTKLPAPLTHPAHWPHRPPHAGTAAQSATG
jgi:hypothetical protein